MLSGVLKKNSNFKSFKYNKPSCKFSWVSRIKRHFDNLLVPNGKDYSSSIIDSNETMYTSMRQFQAFLTKNSYDMSVFNEYDLWPHTNFGTIDNPSLIFSADASWRMVICSGMGSEEESSTHEKMYMIIREGPIHRCMFCGQCFKLVKLKDDVYDERNTYYSSVFTEISPKVIGEPEKLPYLSFPFAQHEMNNQNQTTLPLNRAYLFVNVDEADHLMIDPAKRMEKYKELENDFLAYTLVEEEIMRQRNQHKLDDRDKVMMTRDIYERWTEVEQAIAKFDPVFNRHEKFSARALFDPVNHERRERRMLERQSVRQRDNYTYYFNGLNEEEQQFRDYYETDIEDDQYPDNETNNKLMTEENLRNSGDFNLKFIELIEPMVESNDRYPVEDTIGKSLFKYKYRKLSDTKYESRNDRVIDRFLERAQNRNPKVMEDLGEKLEQLYVDKKVSSELLNNLTNIKSDTLAELMPFAQYVSQEGFQQFKDYYETDDEEGANSIKNELFNDLNERDKLRFAECYENYFTKNLEYDKYYVTIPKRPFDNKKSFAANFVEDLLDFNNRVRPIARHLAFKDATSKYTALPVNEGEARIAAQGEERYKKLLNFKKSGANYLDQLKSDNKL